MHLLDYFNPEGPPTALFEIAPPPEHPCPRCGAWVEDAALRCPRCGTAQATAPTNQEPA